MGKLDGKVAIVTGGASGMGAEHVKRFLDEGAHVVFTDVNDPLGQQYQAELANRAIFMHQDVSDEKDWQNVVDQTVSQFGKVDILVNNAGMTIMHNIVDFPVEDYLKVIKIDQLSVLLGMKTAGKVMIKQKSGSIINISSTNALGGSIRSAAYNSAKAAVVSLTRTGAVELGKYGIRVNSILPGLVATPLVEVEEAKPYIAGYTETIPMRRAGKVQELSGACVYLASDDSSYVNGESLVVDGGLTINSESFTDYVIQQMEKQK